MKLYFNSYCCFIESTGRAVVVTSPNKLASTEKSPIHLNGSSGNHNAVKESEIKLPQGLETNFVEGIKNLVATASCTNQSNFFQSPTIDLFYG